MKYQDIPTKEGGYYRTGSRTPMQWDGSANLGFSTGKAEDLYLPVDSADDAPTVAAQEGDPASLLNTVRAILALRHGQEDLQADAPLEILCSEPDRPFVYRRGSLVCALNPNGTAKEVRIAGIGSEQLFAIGNVEVNGDTLTVGAQSFVVLK